MAYTVGSMMTYVGNWLVGTGKLPAGNLTALKQAMKDHLTDQGYQQWEVNLVNDVVDSIWRPLGWR